MIYLQNDWLGGFSNNDIKPFEQLIGQEKGKWELLLDRPSNTLNRFSNSIVVILDIKLFLNKYKNNFLDKNIKHIFYKTKKYILWIGIKNLFKKLSIYAKIYFINLSKK